MKNYTARFAKSFAALMLTATLGGFNTACGASKSVENINAISSATPNKNAPANDEASENVTAKATPAATDKAGLIPVYDGREGIANAAQKPGTPEETRMLNSEFKRNEDLIMEKAKFECDEGTPEGVEIVGTAEGAFTKANAKQKAFLYERCRAGRAFGIGGIAVVENGKIVAHYIYGENGLSNGILALPDINRNGLSEILLVTAAMNQGYGETAVEILEMTGDKTVFMGRTSAHSDNSGATENEADIESTDYVIAVQPATNPTFFRDVYVQKGDKGKPQLTKKAEKFSLNKDEPPIFVRIS